MKKVLLVSIDGLGNGGVQNVMMNIVRSLSRNYQFDMIVFHKGDNHNYYEHEFSKYGKIYFINRDHSKFKIIQLFRYLIRPFYEYFKYKNIMKKGKYDILHCHNEEESTLALKAAKKCKIPVRISHSHNAYDRDSKKGVLELYRRFLRKHISKYSTCNVGCSIMAGKSLFNNNQFYTIYNAIDLVKFKYTDFCGNDHNLNLINVGRFCDQKNQLFLLKVFIEIKKINSNSFLTFIGYGPDEDLLKKFVIENEVQDVKFLPSDTNVYEELVKNDIFVLPSLYEGFPLSLIEAQITGLKCIVSDSITQEANLGNVISLSLNNSYEEWAKIICDYWKKYKHKHYRVSSEIIEKYSRENFIESIVSIYEGGKIE